MTSAFKKSKSLSSFFKDKATLSKRYKSIQKFLAQDFTHNPEELKTFWIDHHTDVYNVMHQKFSEYDDASKKGGKLSPSREDVVAFMEVFKKLILALIDLGYLNAKLEQTAYVLKRTLHRNNTHKLRYVAFEALLTVLAEINSLSQPSEPINASKPLSVDDALWSKNANKRTTIGTSGRAEILLHSAFLSAIDLRPFSATPNAGWKKDNDIGDEGPTICTSHSPPSSEKSMELLEKLLERMSMSEAAFRFWYELFRDSYLIKFYVPSDINYASTETLNFVAGCPHMVQRSIIEKCALWNESSMMSSIMWEGENARLMMEIGKQCFIMPLQFYPKTIRKALNMFRNTLMSVPKMKVFGNRLQTYWQEFIIALSQVFTTPIIDDWDAYKNLCKEVIGIYAQFYQTLHDKMAPATWEKLLDAILSATVSVVETQGGGHDDSLVELAMRKLYFFWVTSLVPGKEMWGRFSIKIGNLLHWRGTMIHWKDRLIELTQMVLRHYEDKVEPFMKPLDSPSRHNELYTDSTMGGWSYKDIFDRWLTVLGIFGNITALADPENHRIGMSCILEITNLLSETNPPLLPHPIKTLPKPATKHAKPPKISPSNSDSLATTPTLSIPASPGTDAPIALSRTPSSNNLTRQIRALSVDISGTPIDDPLSGLSTPAASVPTSPTSDSFRPIPSMGFDPLSPRAAIPSLLRLVHGGSTPSTPIIPPRNLSPGPTLAPPPTRTSNDLVLDVTPGAAGRASSPIHISASAPEIKTPGDTPKREEISMSILLSILPWIIEACCDDTRHGSHMPGVLCSFQALCRILCSPNFSFNLEINTRFCTCLHVGFWSSKEISSRIITSSARLFNFCRPGLTMMIPEFIKQIRSLFQETSNTPLTQELEIAASTIVNSLICYPNHFGDLNYIRFDPGNKITRFTLDEVKAELSMCLSYVLKRTHSTEGKLSAICGSCVLMLEDLFNEKPNKDMISRLCNQILGYTQNHNESIAQTALDALSALSHSNIASVDRALISTIIVVLCDNASTLINSKEDFHGKENIILAHYWCLIEWIIPTSPSKVDRLSVATVLGKLLEVVELGYYGSKALTSLDFVESNSSQKESLFSRQKKRDNSLSTSAEAANQKKSDIMKKKRRDSSCESSVDLRTIAESPKLGGRKAEIANIMKEVFRHKGKDRRERERERDKDSNGKDDEDDENKDNVNGKKSKHFHGGHSPKVKESAETLLLCILNNYQSFPLFIGNTTTEDDTAPTLYFLHNNKAVWSFSDMRDDADEPFTRIIIRDCTGKYVWNFKPCPRDIPSRPLPPFIPNRNRHDPTSPLSPTSPPLSPTSAMDVLSSSAPTTTPSPSPTTSPTTSPTIPTIPTIVPNDNPVPTPEPEPVYERTRGEPPKFSAEVTPRGVDMLSHFIEYLCDNCPEVIEAWLRAGKDQSDSQSISLSTEAEQDAEKSYCVNPYFFKFSTETKQSLLRQASIENQFYTNFSPSFRPQPMEKPKPHNRATFFDTTRQFLSNFGFLAADNRPSLARLEESGKLRRNLDALDKINERENFKIGVVFVDKGQTTQKEILANSTGSAEYTAFLQALGWEVELATHKGFMGGLDASNGPVTVYSASSTYEVAYHVITLMPTIANDDTQLHKKRHIGNDNVHIVWSENPVDSYDSNTILSQFNDAHVIIYPQPNGLFQVQIYKKTKVQFFGPLANGMLVSKKILPFLVRQTAINANKRVRERTAGYNKPYSVRQTRIQEIAGTCQKNSKAFEEFFATLYKPLGTFAPSSPLLSPSDHTPTMKSHPRSNSSLTLRSEASATSLDALTSLDESDDELSETGNSNSENEGPPSEPGEGSDVRMRFKVPKINIPTSRHTYSHSAEEILPPLLSP
eukprot:Phypoly_transcript_00240.p1 GENE.Phypoly_transcript_00240~~Phypoly_transcript_00240.p1  ORF type:complete len:1865 (+),score=291.42 Phypoly_transcript_00240:55-5649(+)